MSRYPIAIALLTVTALGLLAGCSGAPGRGRARVLRTAADSLADWRARADSIDGTLASLQKVEGEQKLGGATSKYTAWYEGGTLRVIREDLSMGPQGSRTSRFYFLGDAPRFAIESGTVLAGSVEAPAMKKLEREMLFDPYGQLAAGSKTLDGTRAPVADFEAIALAGHAQQLRLAALVTRSGAMTGGSPQGAAMPPPAKPGP